jgi:uncharacterized protein (TIGR00369 family)
MSRKLSKEELDQLNAVNRGTMMEVLGIEYLDAYDGYLKARMPVDERTCQPERLLHGGASAALAETLASFGSALLVDLDVYDVRGSHLNANHIKAARAGWVIGEASIIHKGRNTHVWNVEIKNEEGNLISVCRVTNYIIERRK